MAEQPVAGYRRQEAPQPDPRRSLKEIMDKQDIAADLALKDLAKIEKLKATIHQSACRYYLNGGILGLLGAGCGILFILWIPGKDRIPAWGFMTILIAFIACAETFRHRKRLDALIQLKEIEGNL